MRRTGPPVIAIALTALVAGCRPAPAPADSPAVPAVAAAPEFLDPLVVDADHYALEFENEYVRVLREHLPAGVEGPFHSHRDRVSVYLNAANVTITPVDGAPVPSVDT